MRRSFFRLLAASLLLLAGTFTSKSQVYDTTQIQGYLQYMMQSVDKSQAPTGFLEEYGLPVVGVEPFGEG